MRSLATIALSICLGLGAVGCGEETTKSPPPANTDLGAPAKPTTNGTTPKTETKPAKPETTPKK